MKHARADYDRIQDPAGLIPEDEPVFLLRGQDRYAAARLEEYANDVVNGGGDLRLAELVRVQAQRMRDWPVKKEPDLP